MKKFCTLSVALICSFYMQAQQTSKTVNPLHKGLKAVPLNFTPEKTTANDSRPIAFTYSEYGTSAFEIRDSTIAFYTGNNGFDYATGEWKYDSTRGWSYNKSTSQWEDDSRSYQVIAGNRIMSTLFRQWTGSQWEDDEQQTYTYTNGYIATETDQSNSGSGLENDRRFTNTYNSDNQIIENVVEQWDGSLSQWEKKDRTTYHFNSNKLADTAITYSWNSSTALWEIYYRNVNTYTNGLLTGVLQQFYTGGSWDDNTRSIFTYDTKGNAISMEYEHWDDLSQSWEKIYKETHDYNSLNEKINDINMSTMGGSTYVNTSKTTYTYDGNHRPLTEETASWNATTSQWYHDTGNDHLIRYYYEAYTNNVKDAVAGNEMLLSVYPVPAKDKFNLELKLKEAQPISVAIFDMSGRAVQHWTEGVNAPYHKTVDVSGMPAGRYMIKVTGSAGQAVKTISVVH